MAEQYLLVWYCRPSCGRTLHRLKWGRRAVCGVKLGPKNSRVAGGSGTCTQHTPYSYTLYAGQHHMGYFTFQNKLVSPLSSMYIAKCIQSFWYTSLCTAFISPKWWKLFSFHTEHSYMICILLSHDVRWKVGINIALHINENLPCFSKPEIETSHAINCNFWIGRFVFVWFSWVATATYSQWRVKINTSNHLTNRHATSSSINKIIS